MQNLVKHILNIKLYLRPYFILLTTLHALAMVFVVFYALKSDYSLPDEVSLIQYSGGIKNMLLGVEKKPNRKELLFINTTWEKALIDKNDTVGFPIGKDVITDRISIGKLLKSLNAKPDNHKFIMLDIFFADPSPQDSLLKAELARTKNIALAYHRKPDGSPEKPIFNGDLGLSDMITDNDMVLKYHIVQGDTHKTMPLLMLEKIDKIKYKSGKVYDNFNDKSVLNGFILDYQIRPFDLFLTVDSLRYPMIYISEFLSLPPDMIAKMTKDRIIVVGDFEGSDNHNTIYGKMPGALILINAYYALKNGANQFDWAFVLTMFVAFFIASYFYFSKIHDKVTDFIEERFIKKHFLLERLMEFSFLITYFTLVSIICFWVFNKHITVMIFVAYFNVIDLLKEFLAKNESKMNETEEAKDENAPLMEKTESKKEEIKLPQVKPEIKKENVANKNNKRKRK